MLALSSDTIQCSAVAESAKRGRLLLADRGYREYRYSTVAAFPISMLGVEQGSHVFHDRVSMCRVSKSGEAWSTYVSSAPQPWPVKPQQ